MDTPVASPEVAGARRRWRSAGESLFPALITDPSAYAGAVEVIGAVAAELGRRGAGLDDLVAAMNAPEHLLDELRIRVPGGAPGELLVAVACGMRERDLIAGQVRRDRAAAVARARESGSHWAVLQGPERIEDLTGGEAGGPAGCTHLHLPSGTELRATVDAWSSEPFRVDVIPSGGTTPSGRSFTDRAAWLAEFHRVRGDVEG
ncbi:MULTISPECIES: hypothetical protein [unclassified Pseudonocardia]|uniref:hypothetical protein n=1 Tax=unclassified Pseudonocardia TaxID=2619320 RepID=UPI001ACF9ECF|nr:MULTISPECIES: hypothetical protein [unclassified Pseudonocardia]MBN9099912.1 hypothetical protein [Pseudonocardia sp.]